MNMQAILLGSAVLTVVQAECQTTADGYTWSFQADRDDMLLDVASAESCLSSCFHNSECLGYTWFADQVVNICYLFHVLEDLHDCRECHSKTVPEQLDGEYFNLDPDFLIGVVGEDSAEDCFQSCVDTEDCVGYTWYGLDSLFPNYCFKYSDDTSTATCQGCSSGVMSCIDSLPSSTQSPTTSLSPGPAQCTDYHILDDPTRNINHGFEQYCDHESYHTSPDWHESNYYRLEAPAGVQIPTISPGPEQCGAYAPGWINDTQGAIPELQVGDEITVKVCYQYDNNPCIYSNNIRVTRCPGDYFVYYLVNIPFCYYRYCATN